MLFRNGGGGEFTVTFLWHKNGETPAGLCTGPFKCGTVRFFLWWLLMIWNQSGLDREVSVFLRASISRIRMENSIHEACFINTAIYLRKCFSVRALFSISVKSPVEPKVASPLTKSIGNSDPTQL